MTSAPRIAKAQGRSVAEWIGASNDAMPPPSVRLRIFDRWGGMCHITGLKIQVGDQWDCDHIIRLADGGLNRESNMAPALRSAHRGKTAEENKRGKDADRARLRHVGVVRPKKMIKSRGFPKSVRSQRIQKQPAPERRPWVLAEKEAAQ